jgi:hypothetical protein
MNYSFYLYYLPILIFLCITGCNSTDQTTQDFQTASSLPLMASGKHVSLIKGFNINQPPDTNSAMHQKWNEAIDAGMKIGRIQVDWIELEPYPYEYDMAAFEEKLFELKNDGLQPFVLLSTIDSEGFTIPSDLTDSNTGTLLADDMHFDDPQIFDRFEKLLDWVVPMIISHGGWVLSVGNEPGNFLNDHPSEQEHIANFLYNARAYSHSIDNRLAITMTLAFGSIKQGHDFHVSLLANSDVLSFNYYASDTQSYYDDISASINNELDIMLDLAGDKSIVFQELGASAGYDDTPSQINASEIKQSQFFEEVFSRMKAEEKIRAAVIFQLVDWDPVLVDTLYTQPLLNSGVSQDYVFRLAENLETIGLIRYSDGSERIAWQTVLNEIRLLKQN